MVDLKYNVQFEKLCETLNLGGLINEPKMIDGGLMHRMYVIETSKGKYAVKALNPSVMARPEAIKNFINSELIANIMCKDIPALPAKLFNGASLKELDRQFYLVFDWVEGKTLKDYEISIEHCTIIGAILADMHKIDFTELGLKYYYSDKETLIDWNYYLHKGQEVKAIWINEMIDNIDNLYVWCNKVNSASKFLDLNTTISHGDLDPKNVMWYKNNPIIIDWESAGFINPMFDLLETVMYWSITSTGKLDKDKFISFLDGYKEKRDVLKVEWELVLDKGFQGKLWWLEYSLKRSLQIDCSDDEEQQMGTEHVTGTLIELKNYANMIPTILSLLENNIS